MTPLRRVPRPLPRRLALLPLAALTLAACAGPGAPGPVQLPGLSSPAASPPASGPAATPSPTPTPSPASTPSPAPTRAPARPSKVLVIVEENRGQPTAARQMPYLASLARRYGSTTSYRGVAHPSLPNYLALAGGSTYGVRDDASPATHRLTGPSLFDRAIAAGRTARTYAESMPRPCATTSSGRYAVKHNPWAYFSDAQSRTNCRRFDLPAGTPAGGALRTDIDRGTLPTLGLLVPDLCHDGHDCPLSTADGYLRSWLPRVLAGPDYRAGRLAVVVTFDEDEGRSGNVVLTAVISPYTTQVVSRTAFSHYSLARYFAQLIGRPAPGRAAGAADLRPAFGI